MKTVAGGLKWDERCLAFDETERPEVRQTI
jgi:hypothetical protein